MLGYFNLVLHAHLPFVRHPKHQIFIEEEWLFEAISETYIPLLKMFENLSRDQINFKITLTLTPTLISMLEDEMLQSRYIGHLNRLIWLCRQEIKSHSKNKQLVKLANFYLEMYEECLTLFKNKYNRQIIPIFKNFQDSGNLEIITCSATHAVLPLLKDSPGSLRAQLISAVRHYEKVFKCSPKGIWIPECAYFHGLEDFLSKLKLNFFYLDAHGTIYGEPQPSFSVYAPTQCSNGVRVFSRDIETSRLVWSKEDGYPGDPYYREFYRDLGFEADYAYLEPFFGKSNPKRQTGIKYYRITDKYRKNKDLYEPEIAKNKAKAHANHFISGRISHLRQLKKEMKKSPLITSTYDAELFGHWWFEGPIFLEEVFRQINNKKNIIKSVTATEYLQQFPVQQVIRHCETSWGDQGYYSFWVNDSNDWIYEPLNKISNKMSAIAAIYKEADGILESALNQAARELLLSQSSDWAFIMRTGTSVDYAINRFKRHVARFSKIMNDIDNKVIDAEWLNYISNEDNLFPDINFRDFIQ